MTAKQLDDAISLATPLHQRAVPILRRLSAETNPTVLSADLSKSDWIPLDLSVDNPGLAAVDVKNPVGFDNFIFSQITEKGARVGYGGVFENRSWYQRSDVFGSGEEIRNLHIGLDLWCEAGIAVVCPIDGVIHSFQNNDKFLDYGPTIILEHTIEGLTFYSLYGHLSVESLKDKRVGQRIYKDEEFGSIGASSVNGGWPPHLHFS
jgi:murein DD-endopeptidase MepM/ murein hydrolase activator NlpD